MNNKIKLNILLTVLSLFTIILGVIIGGTAGAIMWVAGFLWNAVMDVVLYLNIKATDDYDIAEDKDNE